MAVLSASHIFLRHLIDVRSKQLQRKGKKSLLETQSFNKNRDILYARGGYVTGARRVDKKT